MSETFHVSLPARLSKVRELSSMVEAFGNANGLSQQRVFVMNLALDELIANTVMHGLQDVPTEIDITLQVHAERLVLTIEDNGRPFDPTRGGPADVTSSLEDRAVGGLGLHLIKAFADRLSYEFVNGRNRVTMEHDLSPSSD